MMSYTTKGLVFVLIGPGGAGKNSLMDALMQRHPHIQQLATATTRPKRDYETQGKQHDFVSIERFREMISDDELLEYQEVTPGRFYGIPRTTIEKHIHNGQHVVADIEVLGAKILREQYPDDVRLIFVTVSGENMDEILNTLKTRMGKRDGDNGATRIEQRLQRAIDLEFPFQSSCDYVICNDNHEEAIKALEQIIISEIAKRN